MHPQHNARTRMKLTPLALLFGFGLALTPLTPVSAAQPAEASAKPTATPAAAALPLLSNAIEKEAIRIAMERGGDWQLANPSNHPTTDWTQGALYTGIMALDQIAHNKRFSEAMIRMGETNEWKLGPRQYHADDHAVGQTYAELWLRGANNRDIKMLMPMRASFNFILANPREFPT